MIAVWFWLAIGTISVQIPNLLGISAGDDGLKLSEVFSIALKTLPITFLATASFIYFYGKGSEYFSYSALTIYGKVAALAVAIIIQVLWLGTRQSNWVEMFGLVLACIGLLLSVYAEPIQAYLQKLTG